MRQTYDVDVPVTVTSKEDSRKPRVPNDARYCTYRLKTKLKGPSIRRG